MEMTNLRRLVQSDWASSPSTLCVIWRRTALLGRVGGQLPLFPTARAELGDPAGDDIEDRRENQSEGGHPDHAEEHRRAQRLPQLRTGADRPDQRRDAENERERGHQDRAEPQPGRLDCGGPAALALILELPGELDD